MKLKGGGVGFVHLDVQRLEAGSVAKQVWLWLPLSPGIARRCCVRRRSCGVDDARDHLGTYEANGYVTKVRQDTVNKKERTGRRKVSCLRRDATSTALDSGGFGGLPGTAWWRGGGKE